MIGYQQWQGETGVILASGPSQCQEDADYVRGHARVIALNTTFERAPWADVCYSNDHDWYETYLPRLRAEFAGALVCGHPDWRAPGVQSLPYDKAAPGLLAAPNQIAWGMNTGGAAIDLSVWLGLRRILLLGYDQSWNGDQPRWHGRHPAHLQNQKPGFHRWALWFAQAAVDAQARGIEIINCSRQTALTCFPRAPLCEAL